MRKLEAYRLLADEALRDINLNGQPGELYSPVRYILDIGGKRLRPAMVLAACELCDGRISDATGPAAGIEVFHNFTLLHDDIMDNAPIRRGKPTVHEKWDTNRAILSGDTMFAIAGQLMLRTRKEVIPDIMSLFLDTAVGVCEGQQMDMNFESRDDVTTTEYLEMIRLKTAILVAASLKTGALIAGTGSRTAENFYEFGISSGMAFQLQDDYLDTFGEEKEFGKKTGGDIAANKKTFLYLKALETADEVGKAELIRLYSGKHEKPDKIQRVTEIFRTLKIDEEARILMDDYYRQSWEKLEAIREELDDISVLEEFASNVIRRKK